jgi:hypothetical protein
MAGAHHRLGDYGTSIRYLTEALDLSRKTKDRSGEALTLGDLCAEVSAF